MFVHLNLSGQFAYSEGFYNYGMLVAQIVGTVINLFTLFVVWRYSTVEMAKYKKHLMIYVVSCLDFFDQAGAVDDTDFALLSSPTCRVLDIATDDVRYSLVADPLVRLPLDFSVDTLSTPIFFLPFPAGTSQGLLRTVFGIETFTVYIIMLAYSASSLHFICANLIFYRWQLILPNDNYWKAKSTWSWCIMNYCHMPFAIIGPIICYTNCIDTNENILAEFKETYPNDSILVEVNGFYWANLQKHPLFVMALIIHTICFIIMIATIFFCSLHSLGVLQDMSNSMSEATRKSQKRFLHQLLIQTMIPMGQIELPIMYWIQVVQYQIRFKGMQNVTNFTFIFFCTHGAVASLFLLRMNRPYRQAVYNIFVAPVRKCLRLDARRNANVAAVVSNVEGVSRVD